MHRREGIHDANCYTSEEVTEDRGKMQGVLSSQAWGEISTGWGGDPAGHDRVPLLPTSWGQSQSSAHTAGPADGPVGTGQLWAPRPRHNGIPSFATEGAAHWHRDDPVEPVWQVCLQHTGGAWVAQLGI